MSSRPRTATRADGSPRFAWAPVRGSDPVRCAAHGGGRRPFGAPAGNANALRHGYYARRACPEQRGGNLPDDCTIDAVIDMLCHKQVALDDFIDQVLVIGRPAVDELAHLLKIHGQNASRIGRLLRDRRALSGDSAGEGAHCSAGSYYLDRGEPNAARQAANDARSGQDASGQFRAHLRTHRRALAETSSAGLRSAFLGVDENCQAESDTLSAEHPFESPSQTPQEPPRRPSAENRGNRPSIRRRAPRNASGGAAVFHPSPKRLFARRYLLRS